MPTFKNIPDKNLSNPTDAPNSPQSPNSEPPTDPHIKPVSISTEMEKAYLDYSMSVIVARALPDVNDGLKPVQRRIIYAMYKQGNLPGSRYAKCASVVGETMKKYHPHGDLSLYDALVRLAQDFSLRYPLVDGQGNFGSIDGDPPAAMRYTECRLAPISSELYTDIDKETVNFMPNYSGDTEEPEVLPTVLPNLLLNGAVGIAVGMATSIPTHNLGEVISALTFAIDKKLPNPTAIEEAEQQEPEPKVANAPIFESGATLEELLQFIKGPDFPTGGIIYDREAIKAMYATGRGPVIMRARTDIEELKGGKFAIIITEIPFQVNKALLVGKIADLVKDKKVEGISDLRDESDRRGIRVVVELKREANPQQVLNLLFKHTELQKTFNGNFVALVKGEPKTLTLKMILEEFVRHRQVVVIRRTNFLLKKAKEREHILLGLKIALDHLDEVIETIRRSPDAEEAKKRLMSKFELSDLQATAILDMQLRRLAALERQKIEDELKEILNKIKDLMKLLASPEKILDLIKTELSTLKEKYADERRSKVIAGKVGEFSEEELVIEERVIICVTQSGYIKRTNADTFKTQGRGGKGVVGAALKEEDTLYEILNCSTHDDIFFFTNKGKVYKTKAWDIPEAQRTAKGTPIVNLLQVEQDEKVRAILAVSSKLENAPKYLFMATRLGTVKKTAVSEFENIRRTGIIAITLDPGDELGWVRQTSGGDEIILTTSSGQSIRFAESDVRAMGRSAGGVRGIELAKEDVVVGADAIEKSKIKNQNAKVLVISENGFGKKTTLSEYRAQGRGGSGIKTMNVTKKTGRLVDARLLNETIQEILVISKLGQIIKMPVKGIPTVGRATQGVHVMRLDSGDSVAAITYFAEEKAS